MPRYKALHYLLQLCAGLLEPGDDMLGWKQMF